MADPQEAPLVALAGGPGRCGCAAELGDAEVLPAAWGASSGEQKRQLAQLLD